MTMMNQQILDSVDKVRESLLNPERTTEIGAGMAYQSVAQATASAVQDASTSLRNISTISTAAICLIVEQMVKKDEDNNDGIDSDVDKMQYVELIPKIQDAMSRAAENFAQVGFEARNILQQFEPTRIGEEIPATPLVDPDPVANAETEESS